MNNIAITIFIVFLGSFSATLLPIKTLNPIAIINARMKPINMDKGARYFAANNPADIWVLSPNSLIKIRKNDAMKGVLYLISFLCFLNLKYNFMKTHKPRNINNIPIIFFNKAEGRENPI